MSYVARKVRTRYVIEVGGKKKRVPKGTPGAQQLTERSKDFYGHWISDAGKKESVRFKNGREKAAAQVELTSHLKKLAMHKAALVPHPREQAAWEQAPIEGHLQAYLAHLRMNQRSEQYVGEVERQARAVFDGVGAKVMADLTAEKVAAYLDRITHATDASRAPSARTKETYRQAVGYFTAWLAKPHQEQAHRIPHDPLATVQKITGEAVRSRRSLDDSDLQKLLDAARARPLANFTHITKGRKKRCPADVGDNQRERLTRRRLERALVYKTALLTLSRYGAIRKLTVDALHLDAAPPHIVYPAKNVKGRREIIKPLPPALVEDLRGWLLLTGKKDGDHVFDLNAKITRELRKDLEFAGIPYKDGLGRTFDFRAFKRCGVTALAGANVNLLATKDYAEHTDMRMTTQAY